MIGTIIVDSGDCLDFDATYNKLINVIKNRFRQVYFLPMMNVL